MTRWIPTTRPGRSPPRAARPTASSSTGRSSVGVRAVLPVASVCAAAGIITSVIVKTGLGQSLADLLVRAARAIVDQPDRGADPDGACSRPSPSPCSAWRYRSPRRSSSPGSIIGPALQTLGASPAETAMFIFYYAVLSEVTPPTALAAVAAAAITGGNTIGTMWQAWKYTLPAFLAPIAFVITDNGSHLLMQGDVWSIVWTTAVSHGRGRCAGRGDRRLDRRPGHPAAAAALRAGRAPAALPAAGHRSASASAFLAVAVVANLITRSAAPPAHRGGTVMIHPISGSLLVRRGGLRRGARRWRRAAGGSSRPPRPETADRGDVRGGHRADHHRHRQRDRRLLRARRRAREPDLGQHARSRRRRPRPARRCRTSSSWSPASTTSRSRWPTRRPTRSRGQGAFTAPQDIQALARIYSNYTHVVVQTVVRDHDDGRLPRQADLHRIPEVGHRGDREPTAAGGRAEPRDATSCRSASSWARPSTR